MFKLFQREHPYSFVGLGILLLLLTFVAAKANAHFLLNVNIRIFHIIHESEQIRVLIRTPLSYLLADKVGAATDAGLPTPAPFTENRIEQGGLVHYLDLATIKDNPQGLAAILNDGIIIAANGTRLPARIGRISLYHALDQVPFSNLADAESSLANPLLNVSGERPIYVGDGVLDVELIIAATQPIVTYSIQSILDPQLAEQDSTANLIIDHRQGLEPLVVRIPGPLLQAHQISRSVMLRMWEYLQEGLWHVYGGYDHLLFLLCLILGARQLSALAWRITGFTAGHSITLALGYWGYYPSVSWFIPLVELMIAITIIYAALDAVLFYQRRAIFLTTIGIGLLHGLGFAFVLQNILNIDSPNLWQSILAFNVAIELAQLSLAVIIWPLMWLLRNKFGKADYPTRFLLAVACIAIAGFWVGERFIILFA